MIIEELDAEEAVAVYELLPSGRLSNVFDATGPDITADVLKGLSPETAHTALSSMETASDVIPLLGV